MKIHSGIISYIINWRRGNIYGKEQGKHDAMGGKRDEINGEGNKTTLILLLIYYSQEYLLRSLRVECASSIQYQK